ncbi:MAG: gephyrin-like molybdotransferase Glp [Pseudomonadota bacterium]
MAELLSVEAARVKILKHAKPTQTEHVAIIDAAGRVLAEPVCARLTQPPFAASAMDGYAVRHEDVAEAPVRLIVIGEAPAGTPFTGAVSQSEAVRIFTGGVIPDGANHVVIQEDTERDGDHVTVQTPQPTARNIRAAGIDFHKGEMLLSAGRILDGRAVTLAATGNNGLLPVHRRPTVAFLATGDELVEPGGDLAPGHIVNSAVYGLSALAESWGAKALYGGVAADETADIAAKIGAAAKADVIVPIGGASVGDYDLVKGALGAEGLELVFEKIAVKPGKPTWFGTLNGSLVLGLPGNPASATACAELFLKPLIYALTGRDAAAAVRRVPARLSTPLGANGPRENYLRASCRRAADGVLETAAFAKQDSSLTAPFAAADCLIRQAPHDAAKEAGSMTDVLLLTSNG